MNVYMYVYHVNICLCIMYYIYIYINPTYVPLHLPCIYICMYTERARERFKTPVVWGLLPTDIHYSVTEGDHSFFYTYFPPSSQNTRCGRTRPNPFLDTNTEVQVAR